MKIHKNGQQRRKREAFPKSKRKRRKVLKKARKSVTQKKKRFFQYSKPAKGVVQARQGKKGLISSREKNSRKVSGVGKQDSSPTKKGRGGEISKKFFVFKRGPSIEQRRMREKGSRKFEGGAGVPRGQERLLKNVGDH